MHKDDHIGKLARLPNGQIGLIVGCDTALNILREGQKGDDGMRPLLKDRNHIWLGGDLTCTGMDILLQILVEGSIINFPVGMGVEIIE